jgi:hypothetical protein
MHLLPRIYEIMNLLQQWLDGSQDYETGRTLYEQFGDKHQLKRTLSHGPTAYNKSALREELARLLKAGKGGDMVLRVLSPADQAVLHQAEQAPTVVETVIGGQLHQGLLSAYAEQLGKSFDQLHQAVLDAQGGQFERLKEFGIRASLSGDQLVLDCRGAQQSVANTPEALLAAVVAFCQPVLTPVPPDPVAALVADLESQWKPLYKDASTMQSLLEYAKDNAERCTLSHEILNYMDKVHALWETQAYVQEHGQLPPVVEVSAPASLDLTDRAAVEQARDNLRSNISKQKRNQARAAEVEAWRVQVKQLSDLLKTL